MNVIKSAEYPKLCVEAATGFTLVDVSVGTNFLLYAFFQIAVTGGTGQWGMLRIPLDANGQFKWCSDMSGVSVEIGSAIVYEM